MEIAISRQIMEALVAFGLGAAAGIFYDILRVLRSRLRSPIVTFISDIIFGVVFGLALFFAGMTAGEGRQRLFMTIIAAIGGTAYF